jgi:hypothetical protein
MVRAVGGTVSAASSLGWNNPAQDRRDLGQIADGVTDTSYSGRLAYTTDDGQVAQPPGGDWYRLNFGRDVTLASLVFYEGDLQPSHSNDDPRAVEPRGGYFLNLTVEVGCGGVFTPVANLALSEPLDPFTYFQRIALSFDPVAGDAVRIRGDAGGTFEFTSILELEAYGRLDMADGHAVTDYEAGASPLAQVAGWLRDGLHSGAGYWDGPGLASSAAAADAQRLTALGVLDNADPEVGGKTTFEGETVDAAAVLIKYTWWGDANLDGVVDANDYDVIDRNFLVNPPAEDMGWWTGDLNYDGAIDANDYDLIDRAFLFQGDPLAGGMPASTPEPATLALVILGAAALAGRRRAAPK